MEPDFSIISAPREGTALYTFGEPMFEASVVDRPNRFIVNVMAEEGPVECHLHDPGRLRELIFPGNRVLVRKTKGARTSNSITAASLGGEWILTDTRIHSAIASRFLPVDSVPEVRVGSHRIDFKWRDYFIEVKGCTLMEGDVATFPDAPTKRGREHVSLLADHAAAGGDSLLMILVFRKGARCFRPNRSTDPGFAETLEEAVRGGVSVFIPRLFFDGSSVKYLGRIEFCGNFGGE